MSQEAAEQAPIFAAASDRSDSITSLISSASYRMPT